jgi:hypothetical protein
MALGGCGGSSPVSPSTAPFATGATISGVVVGASPAGMSPAMARPQAASGGTGVEVSLAGTDQHTTIDRSGHFSFSDVPGGTVTLTFSGGVHGSVSVADVASAETIQLSVSLDAGNVTLESSSRRAGGDEELEGRVEALPPTTAPGSLVVAGVTVTTDASTSFLMQGSPAAFADLAVGVRVHVKGSVSGDTVAASLIDIQNPNGSIPVEINGIVSSFQATATGFSFEVDDRLITGDANTEFFGQSTPSDLQDGVRVEVKGEPRNGSVYAVRIHVDDTDDTTPPETSASIEGLLTASSGTTPALTLTVAGTTVHTTDVTEVRRRGDVQDLSVLALQMTLHVEGTREPDGSLTARMIQIKDDAVGGAFEIAGAAGGVSGTCPALRFGVNGFSIVTSASTTFETPCAGIHSGSKVHVTGTVQADGTVEATTVNAS